MRYTIGSRYLNFLGEYCIIKRINKNLIKLQICGINSREQTWKVVDFENPSIGGFIKVDFPEINRTNIARHLLEYQLNLTGKTTADTKREPNWFNEWTIFDTDFELLKIYAIPLLRKTFKFNTTKAKSTFSWWNIHFGLKIIKDGRIR